MDDEQKKLLERGVTAFEHFLKGKISLKISYGLIAAGVSILGFGDFVPYFVVLVRPELFNLIDSQSNYLTTIGIVLVVMGAFLPVFVQVFNYYKNIYIKDIERINNVISAYNMDGFNQDMNHIASTMSMFFDQNDKIEDFINILLDCELVFSDKLINTAVKDFGGNLSSFNSKMARKMEQVGQFYRVMHRTDDVKVEIVQDCQHLIDSFRALNEKFNNFQHKKIMRFFV